MPHLLSRLRNTEESLRVELVLRGGHESNAKREHAIVVGVAVSVAAVIIGIEEASDRTRVFEATPAEPRRG